MIGWIKDAFSKAQGKIHLVAYSVLVGALLAVSAVAWWQDREKGVCQSSLAVIASSGKTQIETSRTIGNTLKPIADQDREANRKAVEGTQGGGCAISGDSYNRLRERQAR